MGKGLRTLDVVNPEVQLVSWRWLFRGALEELPILDSFACLILSDTCLKCTRETFLVFLHYTIHLLVCQVLWKPCVSLLHSIIQQTYEIFTVMCHIITAWSMRG